MSAIEAVGTNQSVFKLKCTSCFQHDREGLGTDFKL